MDTEIQQALEKVMKMAYKKTLSEAIKRGIRERKLKVKK